MAYPPYAHLAALAKPGRAALPARLATSLLQQPCLTFLRCALWSSLLLLLHVPALGLRIYGSTTTAFIPVVCPTVLVLLTGTLFIITRTLILILVLVLILAAGTFRRGSRPKAAGVGQVSVQVAVIGICTLRQQPKDQRTGPALLAVCALGSGVLCQGFVK